MTTAGLDRALAAWTTVAVLALGIAACGAPARAANPDGGAACPTAEPKGHSACGRGVGEPCSYTIPALRTVHCHCVGPVWSCDTPLGIDSLNDAPGCPAQPPMAGQSCTLQPPAQPTTFRPGCRYQVAATPIVRDCFC